ncbi:hypothetical protein B4U80_13208 [Leptotrombidium deliense]|uniref:Uncharacterized protein n=1 Tax=Leptotrombidium deliense TaxID=299467 RepID=A0A443SAL1_9ACAR|nr:hypothetical protein B4U80_13208 [Leptotrombidium deliense]
MANVENFSDDELEDCCPLQPRKLLYGPFRVPLDERRHKDHVKLETEVQRWFRSFIKNFSVDWRQYDGRGFSNIVSRSYCYASYERQLITSKLFIIIGYINDVVAGDDSWLGEHKNNIMAILREAKIVKLESEDNNIEAAFSDAWLNVVKTSPKEWQQCVITSLDQWFKSLEIIAPIRDADTPCPKLDYYILRPPTSATDMAHLFIEYNQENYLTYFQRYNPAFQIMTQNSTELTWLLKDINKHKKCFRCHKDCSFNLIVLKILIDKVIHIRAIKSTEATINELYDVLALISSTYVDLLPQNIEAYIDGVKHYLTAIHYFTREGYRYL